MQIAMPGIAERLTYMIVAAVGLTALCALVAAIAGASDLVAAVLMLAIAIGVYRLIGCREGTILRARDVAATAALLVLLVAIADLVTGYPYQAILALLAAAALGFAFLLLQQGTEPVELRLAGILAVAAPSGRHHRHMLEALRDAGILTEDEFQAKSALVQQ